MSNLRTISTAAFLSVLAAPPAFAQGPGAPALTAGVPLGVQLVQPPPAGLDIMAASPTVRGQYQLPPAPDKVKNPAAYRSWVKAVAGASIHETATLTQTGLSNRPASIVTGAQSTAVSNNTVTGTSNNWSGSATTGIVNPSNQEAVIQEFVVPTAHQAFGSCNGTWDYSSVWPGIDGYGSGDVLQGGIEADAYCSGSTNSSYYSAWVEWYPYNETRVSSPSVSPGDLMFVEVWNTSPTTGYVYFHNYSTNVSAEYYLTPPSGTSLVGNSVEWIVERPGVGGGLATLTNYIDVTSTHSLAWDYTQSSPTYYYPYSTPSAGTLHLLTMVDNNGAGISSGSGFRYDTLWFLNFGSSCGLGNSAGNPC